MVPNALAIRDEVKNEVDGPQFFAAEDPRLTRVGKLPLVPYFPPGDMDLAKAVREMASDHHAVLLANHGPVVAGTSLMDAVCAIEELEETAKLYLALQGMRTRPLTEDQIADLNRRYSKDI